MVGWPSRPSLFLPEVVFHAFSARVPGKLILSRFVQCKKLGVSRRRWARRESEPWYFRIVYYESWKFWNSEILKFWIRVNIGELLYFVYVPSVVFLCGIMRTTEPVSSLHLGTWEFVCTFTLDFLVWYVILKKNCLIHALIRVCVFAVLWHNMLFVQPRTMINFETWWRKADCPLIVRKVANGQRPSEP